MLNNATMKKYRYACDDDPLPLPEAVRRRLERSDEELSILRDAFTALLAASPQEVQDAVAKALWFNEAE